MEFSDYVEGRTDAAGTLDGSEILAASKNGSSVRFTTQDLVDEVAGGVGAVASVNGQTGVVVLDAGDVGADPAGSASTAQSAAIAASSAATIGIQDLFIPASAMWPTITNGCSALTQSEFAVSFFNIQTLDFDQTTEEHAQLQLVMPRKWNNSTITFIPYWTAAAGTPGQTVRWQMSGAAYANNDSLITAPGTAIAVDDALLTVNCVHIGPESAAMTFSNTPASRDFLMLQIHRKVADDDLAADAKLLGVTLMITTTSAKDS